MGWTNKGSGNRTLATTISKNGVNNFIYGDDAHTDAATSELAFAGVENGTTFQSTFEFETPEWITGVSAVENANSPSNQKYYNLKFSVAANTAGSPARTGNIVIKYHEQSLTLTVNQEAGGSTAYTLYIYDPSKLSTHFSYYRVNSGPNAGSNPIEIPDNTYTIQLYTYSSSTENNKITVELQPKSTNIASKFGFTTSTSSPVENLVKYTGTTVDELYANHGFSSVSYSSAQGYGYTTTNSNTNMWGENISTDASTFINLDHMAPYPPIDIYISNQLQRTKIINILNLYMYNIGEFGGGLDLGNFCSFKNVAFPSSQEDLVFIDSINRNGTNINLDVVIPGDIEESRQISENLVGHSIIGEFKFVARTSNGDIELQIEQNDNLFAIAALNNAMIVKLNSNSNGSITIDFVTVSYANELIIDYSGQEDISCVDYISLKLPSGYIFSFGDGIYESDNIRLNINYNFSRH